MKISANRLRWALNLWPPFLFAGIRVLSITPDFSYARVRLRRYWFNRNYVGTHFGGSLFAMTDPFLMLMGIQRMGRDFLVWDRAAEISFERAVRKDVFAEFSFPDSLVADLGEAAANGDKHLRWFDLPITTAGGDVVAQVRKQLYVRRKKDR